MLPCLAWPGLPDAACLSPHCPLQVGATIEDIVRTRLFVRNMQRDGESISKAHGEVGGCLFGRGGGQGGGPGCGGCRLLLLATGHQAHPPSLPARRAPHAATCVPSTAACLLRLLRLLHALQVLGHVKPASTMVEVSRLVHEDILVLVEVDAITDLLP